MRRFTKFALAAGFAAIVAGAAGIAMAQGGEDSAVAGARASGAVGEQADGYLGFAQPPAGSLKAAVDAVNIKRRAVYSELAAKRGATVQEVAAARGCDQLRTRVGAGEAYLSTGGWQTRQGSAPVPLPSYCG